MQKLPPQSLEAERSVLGAVLLEGEAILKALELLEEEDFYREAHRKIFSAMVELFERQEAIDLVTVAEELQRRGQLEAVGGKQYLGSLAEETPTAANIWYYARIVKDRALQRALLNTTTEVASRVYEGQMESDELLDFAERRIFQISDKRVKGSFVSMKEAIKDTFKMIESLYERTEAITGVPSGFKDLDEYTSGFQKGDLIIVGGRPSTGKTAFGLNIARHIAVQMGEPVAIFSLEMSLRQVVLRMLCAEAMVDAHLVRKGLVKQNFQKLATAAGRLMEAPLMIDDPSSLSVLEMRAKARRLKREHGLSLIVVDYLQLMRGRGRHEKREQEISEISRSLKALAKELDVPVLALSQLNRAVERERRRPSLADLRESGAIEQDADVIIFLYRDREERDADFTGARMAEVVNVDIAKQRNGPTASLKLTFLGRCTRFMDFTDESYPLQEEEVF